MTGDTTRRTVLTGMGAAAILGGTGIATAGGDDSESDDDNGNGDGGNVASIKGFHASPDAPNVDVYVNDVLVLEDVAFGEVSDYLVLLSGEYDVTVVPTGEDTDAAVIDQSVDVPAGAATAVVVGEAPADSYTLEIRPADGDEAVAEFDVDLAPNTVYSAYAVGYLEPEDDQPSFDLLLDVDALTPDTEGDDADQAADDGEDEDETASVSFEDQESDGASVEVDEATLPDGGFVTIHDSSLLEGEVTGSVIGVSEYLESGDHEDVDVDLYEDVPGAEFDQDELTEDQTLIAMPHLDTNDNEEYDFVESEGEDDGPYTEDDEPVTDDAEITVEGDDDDEADDEDDGDDEEADSASDDAADDEADAAADGGNASDDAVGVGDNESGNSSAMSNGDDC